MAHNLTSIFDKGILVDVDVSVWSARKRNRATDLGIEEAAVPDFVTGLGMARLLPKATIRQWQSIAERTYYTVHKHSLPFPVGGARFVPYEKLDQLHAELAELREELFSYRDLLDRSWDTIRQEMLDTYPEHRERIERDFPASKDAALEAFGFTVHEYEITFPRGGKRQRLQRARRDKEAAALQRYEERLNHQVDAFLTQAVNLLRGKARDLCQTIITRIQSGEAITNRNLNTLRTYVEHFKAMNIAEDGEVASQLDELTQRFLAGHDASSFVNNDAFVAQFSSALTGLVTAASQVSDYTAAAGYRRRLAV